MGKRGGGVNKVEYIKNEYDKWFSIRVNLFILRYFWNCFHQQGVWKGRQLYGSPDILGVNIERNRLADGIQGSGFMFRREDGVIIANRLGIDERYFEPNGAIIHVDGLTADDWKYALHNIHLSRKKIGISRYAPKEVEEGTSKDKEIRKIRSSIERIRFVLQNKTHSSPEAIESKYGDDEPLYCINYFIIKGRTYVKENDEKKAMDTLCHSKVQAWDALRNDTETLERYRDTLLKHLEYINALLVIQKAKS